MMKLLSSSTLFGGRLLAFALWSQLGKEMLRRLYKRRFPITFQVASMAFLLALVATLVISLMVLKRYRRLPSPQALPIVGHLHLLGKVPHHSLYKISQEYGPLVKLWFGSTPFFFASNSEMAKEFLKTKDHIFASRPGNKTVEAFNHPKDLVFAPYGEYWKNLRTLCAQDLLSEKKILSHQPRRAQEMSHLLLEVREISMGKTVVILRNLLSNFTYNALMEMMVGKAYAGRHNEKNLDDQEKKLFEDFRRLTHELACTAGQFHLRDFVRVPFLDMLGSGALRDKIEALMAFWERVFEEHHGQDKEDFLSSLLSMSDYTKQHAKAFLQGLIAAGTDATAIAVEWTMAEVLHHPLVLRKLQAELDSVMGENSTIVEEADLHKLSYLHAVVKESLRLHPPVPLTIPHLSMEDCKVGEHNIPKESCVYVNLYAVARDPNVWARPEEFWPERFLGTDIDVRGHHFSVIPFSSGRRGCPGASLGLLSIHFLLANLIYAFDWELPNGKHSLAARFGIIAPLKEPLAARPIARTD